MTDVRLIGLSKRYGEFAAVDNVDLHVEEGEFLSLLGPSGCGKSTTLRMIAGFVKPSAGRVLLGGEDVTYLPPEKRQIGIVFQNYAIFPHMNVYENIAFGLRLRKAGEGEIASAVAEVLERLGLSGFENRFQRELSGGQMQRVALARVLVTRPRILLLDEPLSALDKKLREEMKIWLKDLQRDLSITTVYVTHDQGEALTMSNRIAVMNRAKLVQVDTPTRIYERPGDLFVTRFIGDSNIIDTTVERVEDGYAVLRLGEETCRARAIDGLGSGERASLVVRPENVRIGGGARGADEFSTPMEVADLIYQGPILRYALRWRDSILFCDVQNRQREELHEPGSRVDVGWGADTAVAMRDGV